jgi:nifR3 family TIM-barrel protein
MVSAAALARGNRKTLAYLECRDKGDDLTIQVFGADPEELTKAADLVQEVGFGRVDFNMGCPVRKVVGSGAGAALLSDLRRAGRCLAALRKSVHGFLSVKIRSGWDLGSVNCLAVGQLAADCGVDLITLHPRTRAQGYSGKANWSLVRDLAAMVPVPVVGNGDVTTAHEAVQRMRETQCAGVMIGRAALTRPWIFHDVGRLSRQRPLDPAPEPAEVGRDLAHQLADLVRWKGERRAVLEMRKFLAWGVKGMPGAVEFRRRTQVAADVASLAGEMERFFGLARTSVQEQLANRGLRHNGGGIRRGPLPGGPGVVRKVTRVGTAGLL